MSGGVRELARLVDELFDVYLDEDAAGRVEILGELRGLDRVKPGYGSWLVEQFVECEREVAR